MAFLALIRPIAVGTNYVQLKLIHASLNRYVLVPIFITSFTKKKEKEQLGRLNAESSAIDN